MENRNDPKDHAKDGKINDDDLVEKIYSEKLRQVLLENETNSENAMKASAEPVYLFDDSPPVHSMKFATSASSPKQSWGIIFSHQGSNPNMNCQKNFLKLLSEEVSWNAEIPFISTGELFKDQFGNICGFEDRETKKRYRAAAWTHLEYLAQSSFWSSPLAEFLCGALLNDLDKIKLLANQGDPIIEIFLAIEYMVRDKMDEAFTLVLSAFKTIGFGILSNGESQLIPPLRPILLLIALLENVSEEDRQKKLEKIETDNLFGAEGKDFFISLLKMNNKILINSRELLKRLMADEAYKKSSKFLASELIKTFFNKEQYFLDRLPVLIHEAAEDGNDFASYLKFKEGIQILSDAENEQEPEPKDSVSPIIKSLGIRYLYRDMLVRLGADAIMNLKIYEGIEIYQTMYVLGDNTAIYVLHSLLCFIATDEQKPFVKRNEALSLSTNLADEMINKNLKGAFIRKAISQYIKLNFYRHGYDEQILNYLPQGEEKDNENIDYDPVRNIEKSCISLCIKTLEEKKITSFNLLWACDILNRLRPDKACYEKLLLGEIFKQPFDALKAYILGRYLEKIDAPLANKTACFQIIDHMPLEFLYEFTVRFFQKRKMTELETQAKEEETIMREGLKQARKSGNGGLSEKLQMISGKSILGLQENQIVTPSEGRDILGKIMGFDEKNYYKNMKEELLSSKRDENFEITAKLIFPQPEDYSEANIQPNRTRALGLSMNNIRILQSALKSSEPWIYKLKGPILSQTFGRNLPAVSIYQGDLPVFTKEEVILQEGKDELFLKSNQKCKMLRMENEDNNGDKEILTPFSIKEYGVYDDSNGGKFMLREPLIPEELISVLTNPNNYQFTVENQISILAQLSYILVSMHISGLYGFLAIPGVFYLTDDEKKTVRLSKNFLMQASSVSPVASLLPPEWLLKANPDQNHLLAKGDVWVLGSIIYLVANRIFFIDPNEKSKNAILKKREEFLKKGHLTCKVLALEERGHLHELMEKIINNCLIYEVESRPSAIEVLLELHKSLKGQSAPGGIFDYISEYSNRTEDFRMIDELLNERNKRKAKNNEAGDRKDKDLNMLKTAETYGLKNIPRTQQIELSKRNKSAQGRGGAQNQVLVRPTTSNAQKEEPVPVQQKRRQIQDNKDGIESSDFPQQKRRIPKNVLPDDNSAKGSEPTQQKRRVPTNKAQPDNDIKDEPTKNQNAGQLEIDSAKSEQLIEPSDYLYYLPGNNQCIIVQNKKLVYLKPTMEYHLEFKGSIKASLCEARGMLLMKNGCLFDGTFSDDLYPKSGVFKHLISETLAPVSFEANSFFPRQDIIADLVYNKSDKQKYLDSKNKFRKFLTALKASSEEPRFIDLLGNEYSCNFNDETQPFISSEATPVVIYTSEMLVYFPNAYSAMGFDLRNFLLTEYEEIPQADPPTLLNLLASLQNATKITMNSVNRFRFTGGLADGEPESGLVTFEDQKVLELNGKFIDNLPYSCILNYPDGYSYRGDIFRGKLHGRGELGIYGEAPIYVGEFYIDKMKSGIIYYRDHPKYLQYEGQVKCDGDPMQRKYLKHGRGTLIFKNNDKYEGEFYNDMIEGSGKIYYSDNGVFEGTFLKNMKHGKGIFYGADCTTFEGMYFENKRNGKGCEIYPNGEKYSGDYLSGKREGRGEYVFKNGDRYVGEFKDDKKHGNGELISDDDSVIKVKYYKDKLISQAMASNTMQGFYQKQQSKKV